MTHSIRGLTLILILLGTNICRIDRLNRNGGFLFYDMLISLVLTKVNH